MKEIDLRKDKIIFDYHLHLARDLKNSTIELFKATKEYDSEYIDRDPMMEYLVDVCDRMGRIMVHLVTAQCKLKYGKLPPPDVCGPCDIGRFSCEESYGSNEC